MTGIVTYIAPEWGLPGVRYLKCQPMSATIAVEACAANWRSSHEEGSERLHKCRTCPVGALHAGETLANLAPFRGASICSRDQTGTTRLIGGWLCVSCYNREREVRAGRNAKGKVPTKIAPLHRRSLRVIEGREVRTITRDLTAGIEELMAAALRDCRQVVRFAFNGVPSAQYGQGALW